MRERLDTSTDLVAAAAAVAVVVVVGGGGCAIRTVVRILALKVKIV
jgi:hypothetical protein